MFIVKEWLRLAATLGVAATVVFTGPTAAAHASSAVPWTDPAVSGVIGLCNSSGQPIEGGSVSATPFVARAVSSVAAPAPYNKAGRTATLYAFQPHQGLAPGQWSGDMLTASTRYANAAYPTAVATGGDLSLAGFISEFPPAWDGLLQLRLYLSAPDEPAQSLSYAATTIKVTGSTWSVVSGGNVSCNSGAAESIESILLPKKSLATPTASPATSPAAAGATSGTSPAPSQAQASPAGGDPATLDATSAGSGHSTSVLELVVIAVLAASIGGAGVSWLHRRSKGRTS
jgi:hypothetical protein